MQPHILQDITFLENFQPKPSSLTNAKVFLCKMKQANVKPLIWHWTSVKPLIWQIIQVKKAEINSTYYSKTQVLQE